MTNLGKRSSIWAEFKDVYSTKGGKYRLKLYYYSDKDRDLTVSINGKKYLMKDLNSGGIDKKGVAYLDNIK